MAKRTPLRLDVLHEEAGVPPQPHSRLRRPCRRPAAGRNTTTTVYARVPWALGEELRDLARRRSREEEPAGGVNDLVVEALRRLLG